MGEFDRLTAQERQLLNGTQLDKDYRRFMDNGYAAYAYNNTRKRIDEMKKSKGIVQHKDVLKALRGFTFEAVAYIMWFGLLGEGEKFYGPGYGAKKWRAAQRAILADNSDLSEIPLVPDSLAASREIITRFFEFKSTFSIGKNMGQQMDNYLEAADLLEQYGQKERPQIVYCLPMTDPEEEEPDVVGIITRKIGEPYRVPITLRQMDYFSRYMYTETSPKTPDNSSSPTLYQLAEAAIQYQKTVPRR